MIARLLLAALGAGLLAGLLLTPIQYVGIIPLILEAEVYEDGGMPAHDHAASILVAPASAAEAEPAPSILVHAAPKAETGEEGPVRLFASRLVGTLLANLVAGAGFALVLTAASLALARPISRRNGLLWGLLGFAVASLAPAIRLAPELPAMPAADLLARQTWWLATVGLSALGAGLMILRREPALKALGVLALALPHLYGAPQPTELASPVPPTLAAEFAVASLVTALAFWLILGSALGYAFDRLNRMRGPQGRTLA